MIEELQTGSGRTGPSVAQNQVPIDTKSDYFFFSLRGFVIAFITDN